jgi:hypothetical protein
MVLLCLFLFGSAAYAGENQAAAAKPWFVSMHLSDLDDDLEALHEILPTAKEAGFAGIRTDIFWWEIEPVYGTFDAEAIEKYRTYWQIVRQHGLEMMPIVSGIPEWAKLLLKENPEAFWKSFETYVQSALDILPPDVPFVQVSNEPNFLRDPIKDDPLLFRTAGKIIRTKFPGAKIIVNPVILVGWMNDVRDWLRGAGEYIDIIGIDYYPGLWHTAHLPSDWSVFEELLAEVDADKEGLWQGKQVAISETGFSTFIPISNYQAERSLAAIHKIHSKNELFDRHVAFLNWYKLMDNNSRLIGDNYYDMGIESKFGMIKDRFFAFETKKLYDIVAKWIDRFKSEAVW